MKSRSTSMEETARCKKNVQNKTGKNNKYYV